MLICNNRVFNKISKKIYGQENNLHPHHYKIITIMLAEITIWMERFKQRKSGGEEREDEGRERRISVNRKV